MLIAAGQSVKQGRFSAVLIPDQGNNHRVITYLRVDFSLQNKQLLIKEQKAATLQKNDGVAEGCALFSRDIPFGS